MWFFWAYLRVVFLVRVQTVVLTLITIEILIEFHKTKVPSSKKMAVCVLCETKSYTALNGDTETYVISGKFGFVALLVFVS